MKYDILILFQSCLTFIHQLSYMQVVIDNDCLQYAAVHEHRANNSCLNTCITTCILQPHTKVTETYKGVHWGKYSTKRTDFSGKAGPGPGEYDPQHDISLKTEHLNLRGDEKNKKFEAKIPRYHEWVVKEEEKKVCIRLFLLIFFER